MSIEMTSQAIDQLFLIQENDYTLEGLVPRLTISGKECDGFRYSIGFTASNSEDQILNFKNDSYSINLHLDPFTTYYFKNGKIDFILDIENSTDGFVITNFDQDKFQGKFYKDESMTPLHLLANSSDKNDV